MNYFSTIEKIPRFQITHCDRTNEDDYNEMNDKINDNSAAKGCCAKNKSKIDEGIHIKVPVNMGRKVCKTKVSNSIEKRSSTIENVYNCGNDHQCEESQKEINAIECPNGESPEEQIIFVCTIHLVINDQELMQSSLITSDESMVISSNTTINESWHEQKKQI